LSDTDTDTDTDKFIYQYHYLLIMPKITQENKRIRDYKIRLLLDQNKSTRYIANEIGCSLSTVSAVKNNMGSDTDTDIDTKKEIIIPKIKIEEPIRLIENIGKLTMDEIRANYIFICKKSPKHDSKQTKEVLINDIIEVLKSSI